LREGGRGNAVATAQALLITGGSAEQARLGPTGTFDSGTARAVRAFQQRVRSDHGAMLQVDGSIGPATWGWLFVYATATGDAPAIT
jgi:peptidoglycan hydrolase-like protein with peptidoglycan-binding domain